MEIKLYDPFIDQLITSLEKQTAAKVLRTIDLLEKFGAHLGMPHSKKVAPSLFELRARGKHEVRIFYTFQTNAIVLLHGFIKKSQKLPQKEIETAKRKLHGLGSGS